MNLSIFAFLFACFYIAGNLNKGFPVGSVVKNPPANAGDIGDIGSIPGLGRSVPGEVNGNHSSILA